MTASVAMPTPENLRRRVEALCGIGNRFVGTAGERAARDYVRTEFERSGADVRVESFEVCGYEPRSASVEILGAPELEIPAVGLQFTAAAAVEAQAVYLGSPDRPEDIAELRSQGVLLADRVVVVDTYWPYGLAEQIVEAGAVGLVVVSPNAEGHPTHFTAQLYPPPAERPLPIPGVTIDRRAAGRLLAMMSHGPCRLRIAHDAGYAALETANVVAEVAGTDLADERVVVGGHYDTQLEGVGACDNATGVAAILELASAFAASPRRRTMTFVAFGDEEHGFNGAVDYCRRHLATLDQIVGMICLDALAWAYPASRSIHVDASLERYAIERAREAGWPPEVVVDASVLLGSDHNPFIDAGVPAAWLWRYPPQHPGYHSAGDSLDLVDFEGAAEVAAAGGHLAGSLADDPNPAIGRSKPNRRWHDFHSNEVVI